MTLFDDLIVAQPHIESFAFKNFSALKKSIDEKIIFVRQYSKIIKIIWLECAPLKRMTVLVLTNMNTIALSHYRTIALSHYRTIALLAIASTYSSLVLADLPLSLDELLTQQKQTRLEIGLTYANHKQMGLGQAEPVLIQISPTQFISIPSQIGDSESYADTTILNISAKYGFNARTELYARVSALSTQNRRLAFDEVHSQSDSYVSDVWLGINHVFVQENTSPALVAFAELPAYEATSTNSDALKAVLVGFTSYRVTDPIIFSLTSAYKANLKRVLDNGSSYLPSNYFLLSPSIGFAVNADVTLNMGWQWRNVSAAKHNSQTTGLRQTLTDLNIGAGWGLSKKSTVIFNVKTNISGGLGSELGIN